MSERNITLTLTREEGMLVDEGLQLLFEARWEYSGPDKTQEAADLLTKVTEAIYQVTDVEEVGHVS